MPTPSFYDIIKALEKVGKIAKLHDSNSKKRDGDTMGKQIAHSISMQRLRLEDLSWDVFRSEICHMYKFSGDAEFISGVMGCDFANELWDRKEYAKSLYVLAMIDYLSWKNKVPYFDGYKSLRSCKLQDVLYPAGIVMLDKIEHSDKHRKKAIAECSKDDCGRFFFRHNIIEKSIEDVV